MVVCGIQGADKHNLHDRDMRPTVLESTIEGGKFSTGKFCCWFGLVFVWLV